MSIKVVPFLDVFEDESGGNVKTPQSEYLSAGKFPVVDQGKALIAGYVDDESRLCGDGRPAIVFGDHTRCVKYAGFPFCVGADGVKVLRPKIEADLKYLYYFLNQLDIPNAGYDRHYKYLKRTEVVLQSLPEQRRIAAILDQADMLRAKRREALAQLDSLTQSIFIEMFGDPSANVSRWPTKRLSDLVISGDTINYGVIQPGDDVDEGIPLIRVGDLIDGRVRHDSLKKITPEIEGAYKRSRLHGDEILVSCVGTIGVVVLANESEKGFNIARAVARIRLSPGSSRQFLAAQLQTESVQRYFTKESRTVSQPTLNIKQLSETVVIWPPVSLQTEFSNRIAALEKLKLSAHGASSELDTLFASLQHRAFQGEL